MCKELLTTTTNKIILVLIIATSFLFSDNLNVVTTNTKHSTDAKLVKSFDERYIATFSNNDKKIKIWNSTNFKKIQTMTVNKSNRIINLWFTKDNYLMVFTVRDYQIDYDPNIKSVVSGYNIFSGTKLQSQTINIQGYPNNVKHISNRFLFIEYSPETYPPPAMKVYDLALDKEKKINRDCFDYEYISQFEFSNDKKHLAVVEDSMGSGKNLYTKLHIFNTDNLDCISTKSLEFKYYETGKPTFIPNSNKLVYLDPHFEFETDQLIEKDSGLNIWDFANNTINRIPYIGEDPLFTQDGKYMISLNNNKKTISLYNWKNKKRLREFIGHTSTINNFIFLERDKKIISLSKDGYMILWSTKKFH